MNGNVFYEMEFLLLVIFSLVIPVGIYGFLYKKLAISRWTVVGFALLLVVVAGIDVVLLQSLFEKATASQLLIDNKIFRGQLSIALYLFPAAFAGLGVNLLSHVLTGHLNQAEQEFDKEHRNSGRRGSDSATPNIRRRIRLSVPSSEVSVITGSALAAAAIFVLDLWTGAEIRLHVLYIFPLAMVARHCARPGISVAALTLTTILQVITFSAEAAAISAFVSDVCVAFAASVMVTYLARTSRQRYLIVADLAATDPLTGLANRRAFVAEVEAEIARQIRYGGAFSLVAMDLDEFKALNDARGHLAGDEALKLVAEILETCTRISDSVGRLGGDEFAILMPNTHDVDCGFMLHELCRTIEDRMATAGFALTASVGCKTFAVPPGSASNALEQADEIMYEAKGLGKNRAVYA